MIRMQPAAESSLRTDIIQCDGTDSKFLDLFVPEFTEDDDGFVWFELLVDLDSSEILTETMVDTVTVVEFNDAIVCRQGKVKAFRNTVTGEIWAEDAELDKNYW